jgi:molybdopterin molybdotransferase
MTAARVAAHAISATEASDRILASVEPMPVERCPLASAMGRVIAETVAARVSVPPWRAASMDGYAVRARDIATVPCTLQVVGDSVAGGARSAALTAGGAVRITTGAPVPDGADTVVRVEDTDEWTTEPTNASTNTGRRSVQILSTRDAGRNVRPLGEDFQAGDVLLNTSARITPAAMGVLASGGIATVATYRAPMVSIVSSGDELVRVEDFAALVNGEKIVSSNSYALPALVRDAGGVPRDGGITPDSPAALRNAINAAMACDLLITTGGVSVGDRDYTRTVMRDMGADIKFWRARIRPGGPIAFGVIDGLPWVGLPGNPVSALVTFELFVRPAIRKMLGETQLFPAQQIVTLDEHVTVSGDLTHYLRVVVSERAGVLHASLTGTQSSGALTSMLRANALLIVPEGKREYEPGEMLHTIPLSGDTLRSAIFPA